MESLPQGKSELLEQLHQASTALKQTLSRLSDEQMTGLRDQAGWSVQDHLDHLAVWKESAAMLLERRPRDERFAAMGVDLATVQNSSEDEVNALLRERTPPRTLAQTRSAQEHLLRALEPLNDADLQKTYSHYQPEAGQDSGRPIMVWVMSNSSAPYLEHLPWIEAIAAQGNGA